MATTILVIGESGTGKSTAIRTLDPKETFLINVLDKPLPFKGWRKKYTKVTEEKGNMCNIFCADILEGPSPDCKKVLNVLKYIDKKMENIKTIIIDDFQYLMANEFMRRAMEKGWDKFSEIQQKAWQIIVTATMCRDDLNIFVLSHSETDSNGKTKCKTIGKMLDDKISFEGLFTLVFSSVVLDEKYLFQTRNDGLIMAKTPMDMFEDKYVPNNLQLINDTINAYFDEDIDV